MLEQMIQHLWYQLGILFLSFLNFLILIIIIISILIFFSDSESKHLSPVWNLKWTDKDRASSTGEEDEMEVLMSISSDGRITQWMIRKGFESSGKLNFLVLYYIL